MIRRLPIGRPQSSEPRRRDEAPQRAGRGAHPFHHHHNGGRKFSIARPGKKKKRVRPTMTLDNDNPPGGPICLASSNNNKSEPVRIAFPQLTDGRTDEGRARSRLSHHHRRLKRHGKSKDPVKTVRHAVQHLPTISALLIVICPSARPSETRKKQTKILLGQQLMKFGRRRRVLDGQRGSRGGPAIIPAGSIQDCCHMRYVTRAGDDAGAGTEEQH